MPQHYQQIDVIKGFAIIAVILLHSVPEKVLLQTYAVFHIWQAVPLFMIIMGLNAGMAKTNTQAPVLSLYTGRYFRKKFNRIVFPFLVVFVLSLAAGLVTWWLTGQNKLEFRGYNLIGVLPVAGPGNYFITLLLQSILFIPIISYFFKKAPFPTIIALVVLEVAFLLVSDDIGLFNRDYYLYSSALPRYFSAIALGLVLSRVLFRRPSKVKIFLLGIISVTSIMYLYRITYNKLEITQIRPEWEAQNVLTFSYAAMLILVCFNVLPNVSENIILKFLARLGKASYHIFLLQIIYFALLPDKGNVCLNLVICLLLGYLFCRYDDAIRQLFSPKTTEISHT